MYTLTVSFTDGTHHRSHHTTDLEALETLQPIVTERTPEIELVDINPYGMGPTPPGTIVEILEAGAWVGPFAVTDRAGRTPDHLVLFRDGGTVFEHYADPYNTRTVTV